MIKCPKCGFTQPNDQYCAQCGVDMQRFRPVKRPLASRLVSSSAFYIFLASVLLTATGYLIFTQTNSSPESTIRTALSKFPSTGTKLLESKDSAQSPSPPATPSQVADGAAPSPHAEGPRSPDTSTAPAVEVSPTVSQAPAAPVNDTGTRLKVLFVEGSVEAFSGGSGTVDRHFIYDDRGSLNESRIKDVFFDSTAELSVVKNIDLSNLTSDSRLSGENKTVGFILKIVYKSQEEKSVKVDMNISARWPDRMFPDGRMSVRSNSSPPFSISLPIGKVYYYGGMLQHRVYLDQEIPLKELVANNTILRVMLSPLFANSPNQSDLYILLENLGPESR